MDVFKRVVESCSFVSTMLESPQVVVGVPWPFPQVVIRERIQRSSILVAIPRDNPYDMGVRAHDDSRVACRNTPPLAIGDDAGDEVDPAIELES